MLKLGCSTRSFLLTGPEEDVEEESEMSVTELKKQRIDDLRKKEEAIAKAKLDEEERLKKEEERGVDWGMGEDAEEESDLVENPYAQTNNEELYLDDPKKTLRGYMEREGFEFEYDVTEQGMGQFLCKVVLPLDDARGRPIVAEALVKGKKKEAVVQCALEACRILDRHGVLRQATHESRKRKSKNWEENDYYDSDDDTFLDRTGTVEKKREKRMKEKVPQQPETYQSLCEKEKELSEKIANLEKQLSQALSSKNTKKSNLGDGDSLENFMNELKEDKPDKQTISKLRTELYTLKQEHLKIVKLANIAKPAHLPDLVPAPKTDIISQPGTSGVQEKKKLPLFGKRVKIAVNIPPKKEDVMEEDEEETEVKEENKSEEEEEVTEDSEDVTEKFEQLIQEPMRFPFSEKHQQKLSKIVNQLQKLADEEDRMHVDWKLLSAKKHKVMEQILGYSTADPNPETEHRIFSELNRILSELETMTANKYKIIDKVKKMGTNISKISTEIKEMTKQMRASSPDPAEPIESEAQETEKKKKKNIRRIQQRQERTEVERQRGYDADAQREDYNMWVPPDNQTGDGRTNLNEKFGY